MRRALAPEVVFPEGAGGFSPLKECKSSRPSGPGFIRSPPSTPPRRARTNMQYKVPDKAIGSQHCIRARLQPCRQSNKIYVGLQPLREDLPEGGGGFNPRLM